MYDLCIKSWPKIQVFHFSYCCTTKKVVLMFENKFMNQNKSSKIV